MAPRDEPSVRKGEVSFPCWLSYRLPLPREKRQHSEPWEVRRDTASKKPWIKHKTTSGKERCFHSSEMSRRATLTPVAQPDPIDPVFKAETSSPTPILTEGEQTYIDKVKELEARYSRKNKRQPLKKKRKSKKQPKVARQREVKEPKKKAFRHSDVIKGHGGIMPTWSTALHSLLKSIWCMKKPLLKIL